MKNDITTIHSSNKQKEIAKKMSSISILPIKDEVKIEKDDNFTKIPYTTFLTLGAGLEPVANLLQKFVLGNNQSGLYWVNVPKGTHLAKRRNGIGLLGAVLNNETNQVVGQAILQTAPVDPTTLFMMVTLYAIEYKLSEINEAQKDIQSFLEQKEHSELQRSLVYLTDVINTYKYNWNNELYLKNNHLKTLDIKERAEQKIDFFQSQIRKEITKKEFLFLDKDVKKKLYTVKNDLVNDQLSLYLLSFASLLEIVLSESFDPGYIQSVINKLHHYSLEYRKLYTECYEIIEKDAKNSVEYETRKGISTLSKAMGKTIEKAPLLSKSPIDEALISASDKLISFNNAHTEMMMKKLLQNQGGFVKPFIDTLTSFHSIYSQDLQFAIDDEHIYIHHDLIH